MDKLSVENIDNDSWKDISLFPYCILKVAYYNITRSLCDEVENELHSQISIQISDGFFTPPTRTPKKNP